MPPRDSLQQRLGIEPPILQADAPACPSTATPLAALRAYAEAEGWTIFCPMAEQAVALVHETRGGHDPQPDRGRLQGI